MSFLVGSQRVQVWGIVNLTPNSFSDGGQISEAVQLKERLLQWQRLDGIDIGAESTAPMNRSIGSIEEQNRLRLLQQAGVLADWPKEQVLSLDTYHLETVRWFLKTLPASIPVVWNDVSGQVDENVVILLKEYPQLKYVLCHNPVPNRGATGEHLNFRVEGDVVALVKSFFIKSFDLFLRHDLFSRVIADPGFGFGKSREQNQKLLKQLPLLMDELACSTWMWGVSRKSFLRFPPEAGAKTPAEQAGLDATGILWTSWALRELKHSHSVILRTHSPWLSSGLENWHLLN